ncbi:MAG: Holliday junction endonuclease [Streptomyces sp.]|nr:Holliday junction endonuclease [Streptomyces sp.]
MTPNIIALDLSMTATGLCDIEGHTSTVKTKLPGDQRLMGIVENVRHIAGSGRGYLGANLADLAVIEDLPTHAKSAGITGMVQGAVRVELMRLGVPYVLVTPASLKKWATGKGNADKIAMAVSTLKRFGREFPNDNECDAWCLRAMALDALGCPLAPMPAVNRAALDAVAWPQIGVAA